MHILLLPPPPPPSSSSSLPLSPPLGKWLDGGTDPRSGKRFWKDKETGEITFEDPLADMKKEVSSGGGSSGSRSGSRHRRRRRRSSSRSSYWATISGW